MTQLEMAVAASPLVALRKPGFCSLMASQTERCLKPALFYPGGWRCEKHREKPRWEQSS